MINLYRRATLSALIGAGAAIAVPFPSIANPGSRAKGFLKRHRLPAGVQVYTVDQMARQDLSGTFARLAQIGYRSLELAGFHGHTPRQLRDAADAAGLKIASIHLGDTIIGTTDADTQRIADDLAILGTQEAVLPTFIFPRDVARNENEPFSDYLYRAVRSKGSVIWERTADLLNARAEAFARYGISLAYHNHNVEFEPIDGGRTGWDILMERTDPKRVGLEIDLGWVAAAGIDPEAFVTRYSGRVTKVHIKDIKASTRPNFRFQQDPAEVGSGTLDWGRLLPAAYAAGVRQFFVEQEPPFNIDRFTSLAISFQFLGA